MRSLRAEGIRAAVLAGHFSRRSVGGAWLGWFYSVLRGKELVRASGSPLIFSPGSINQALARLQAGTWVTGTPDVPPTETLLGAPVQLFGQPARFAEGLLVIARRARVPVVVFNLGLDLRCGRRHLHLFGVHDPDEPELLQRIAAYWEHLLREHSWGFSLWAFMPAWFDPAQTQTQARPTVPTAPPAPETPETPKSAPPPGQR